jgi:autotransporter family porin
MNKVYKVTYNKQKGCWVVVSELAKGKTKSRSSGALTLAKAAILSSLLSLSPLALAVSGAASCDILNNCTLDNSIWDYTAVNNGGGRLTVDDGGSYKVTGPDSIKTSGTGMPVSEDITLLKAYQNGWLVSGTGVDAAIDLTNSIGIIDLNYSKTETILVTDPISGVTSSITVYPGDEIKTGNSTKNDLLATLVDGSQTVKFFYDAGMVKVTDGEAEISVGAAEIKPISRNTNFAHADGTGSTAAKVVWTSSNTYGPSLITSVFSPDPNFTGFKYYQQTEFKGVITAYDGSVHNVTDLDSYKVYLDWLATEVRDGRLTSQVVYDNERRKGYGNVTYTFDYDIPNSASGSPELSSAKTGDALIRGDGANAYVEVAAGATLTQTAGGRGYTSDFDSTAFYYGMIVLTEGAQGANYGTLKALANDQNTTMLTVAGTGSRFVNKGTIDIGTAATTGQGSGAHGYSLVARKEATIRNEGTINYYSPTNNLLSAVQIISLHTRSTFENAGTINFAAKEKSPGANTYYAFRGIMLNGANNTFTNEDSGVINWGIDPDDGSFVGVGINSTLLRIYGTQGYSNSENKGTINVGQMVYGSDVVNSDQTVSYFTNSGVINLDGNRNADGSASDLATFNTALKRSKNTGSTADFFNTGTINVDGYANIALKAMDGGKISSSGTINVHGNKTSSGLNNYGAWSEGNRSVIDISGKINLTGDDSIGVYASQGGTINLTGNGEVTFANGSNQIGYYISGAGSAINNTGTGSQNVTTQDSTLIRVAGGASLTGSGSAAWTASGEGANVIVATDSGTTVNTGGMTVNATGKNSVAIRVEGGALGAIDNSTTINLIGKGAIAGIVDGQGHKTDGSANGAIDATTKLTAAANLNSNLDDVIGYYALNRATIENSGQINFGGDGATAIKVSEGAKGINSGDIILSGVGSVGLLASANTESTTLVSTGNITLDGHWDGSDDASRSTGVMADGSQVSVTIGDGVNTSAITLTGSGSVGVHAKNGSSVELKDKVDVSFSSLASDQIAYWIEGAGSTITTVASAAASVISGDGATLFYVSDGASLSGNLNVVLSGLSGSDKVTSGIRVSGSGSQATLGATSQLTIGTNAVGVSATDGGLATVANGASFTISGQNALVGKASGQNSKVVNYANVTSQTGSVGSTAFLSENAGEIVNNSTIDLSLGSNHTAIRLIDGKLVNDGNITASGTAIHISGANSSIVNNSGTITAVDGVAAIHVDTGAGLNLSSASGSGTVVAKGSADGILMANGAVSLNVANTTIDMSDSSSTGIGINNLAGIDGIQFNNTDIKLGGSGVGIKTGASLAANNSGNIDVTDGVGILFANGYGGATAGDFNLLSSLGLVIKVIGSGVGIQATLDGNNRSANLETTVQVNSATGGAAADILGAKEINNAGSLTSQSLVAAVLNAGQAQTIGNSGTIAAASATQNAIHMTNAGDKVLNNSGTIVGALAFNSGNNQINLTGGSVSGKISAADGNNTLTASGGSVHSGDIAFGNGNNVISADAAQLGNVAVGTGVNTVTLQGTSVMGNFTGATNSNNTVTIKGDGGSTPTFGVLNAGTGGNDRLIFDDAQHTQTTAGDILNFENLELINGSLFTSNAALAMEGPSGVGRIAIDNGSTFAVDSVGAYHLNHRLTGDGHITVDTNNQTFSFGAGSGSAFSGDVMLNNSLFTLASDNTVALTNATLVAGSGSITTVGSGVQNIGNLTINHGAISFGNVNAPGGASGKASNSINTGVLKIDAGGIINITPATAINNVATVANTSLGLLDQQANDTYLTLVEAQSIEGSIGDLTVNGISSTNELTADVMQSGNKAAEAVYDYRLTDNNGSGKGLFISYGLKILNLIGSGSNALILTASDSAQKVLSAQVTGSGDLAINADSAPLTLANSSNDYTGATYVQTGKLILGTDSALGQTASLNLSANTQVDLNGKSQTILGDLNTASSSDMMFNGGQLSVQGGSVAGDTLSGAGTLTVASGTLTVNGANGRLTATTEIDAGATALIKHTGALGSGNVAVEGDLNIQASGTLANQLTSTGTAGKVNVQTGDVTVSADNSGYLGKFTVAAGSSLTTTQSSNLGQADVINDGDLNFDIALTSRAYQGVDQIYNNAISGSGQVNKNGAGTLLLTGSNSYTGNTNVNSGTLAVIDDANLGAATSSVQLNGGTLRFTKDSATASAAIAVNRDIVFNANGTLAVDENVVASLENGWLGNGYDLTKMGLGQLVLKQDNSANTGAVNINQGTILVSDVDNLGDAAGTVSIAADASLIIDKTGVAADETFERQLLGSGTVAVDLGAAGQSFNLASSVGNGFTGTIAMNNGQFVLTTGSASALQNATLALNGNGAGKVGSVNFGTVSHQLGHLEMNGGTIYTQSVSGAIAGTATVKDLTVSGGSVAIKDHAFASGGTVSGSYFDHAEILEAIVTATGNVSGAGTVLDLTDENGAPLISGNSTSISIMNGLTQIGHALYDNIAITVDDGSHKGIFLGYGLSELASYSGYMVDVSNAGANGDALGAKLTGAGGFNFDINGSVKIGNINSDYTGASNINSGSIAMLSDNAFGQTSALNMANGTSINMQGYSQTVGELNMVSGSALNLNGGALTVTDGGVVDGQNALIGGGNLTVSGTNVLTIKENNGGLSALVDIDAGAHVALNKPQGLGTGAISNEGTLELDGAAGSLVNAISGANGDVSLTNGADIWISADNSAFGGTFTTDSGSKVTFTQANQIGSAAIQNSGTTTFNIDTGALNLTNAITGAGTVVKDGAGTLLIDTAQAYTGNTLINNGLMVVGSASSAGASLASGQIDIKATGALGGYGTLSGDVVNEGMLLVGSVAEGALTGYASNFGSLTIGGDYTANGGTIVFNTVLEDDSSTTDTLIIQGSTAGSGKVRVINAGGTGDQTSADGIKLIEVQGNSNGTFTLSGRAVAGAYEYFLYQGGVINPTDGHWYLRSQLARTIEPIIRPETGAYLANIQAANEMFGLSLFDREANLVGDDQGVWMRYSASRSMVKESSGQLRSRVYSQTTQLGVDLYDRLLNDDNQIKFGAMFGYGSASHKTDSIYSTARADGKTDGYSVGVYGTWYKNEGDIRKAYIDAWLQHAWLDQEVSGTELANEKYKSSGVMASLEAGYAFKLTAGAESAVYLQPQAQVTVSGVKADSHREQGGTVVKQKGSANVKTRLGVRLFADGTSQSSAAFRPYAEVNWINNSQNYRAEFDGVAMSQSGAKNIGEFKLGADGKLSKSVALSGSTSMKSGASGYNSLGAQVNLKVSF